MSGAPLVARVGRPIVHTWRVGRTAARRRDVGLVFGLVTLGYLLTYLVAVGDLAPGRGEVGVTVVADPLSRALERTGVTTFEPVVLVDLGAVRYLFAPGTALVGLLLSVLVGLNLAFTYLAVRLPRTCGVGTASAGALAAVPALLSGAACCGPVLLLVLGVQASGLLLTAFDALVPLAAVLLVGALLFVARRVDPAALSAA